MKLVKRIFLITILMITILISVSFAQTGKVGTQATRIRKEANTTSDILTVVYQGDEVEILEESGEWYKIKYKDNTGYVKKEFITKAGDSNKSNTSKTNNVTNSNTTSNTSANTTKNTATNTATNTSTNTSKTASNTVEENTSKYNNDTTNDVDNSKTVTIGEVNLKLLPNFISTNITKFEAGKEVTKVSELNNWIQITDGVTVGWVPKSKIKIGVPNSSQHAESSDFEKTNTNTNTTNQNTTTQNTSNTAKTNSVAENKTTPSTSVNKEGTINVETAKLREKASTSGALLGFLDYADKVTINAEEGDWYKVTHNNVSGYVNKKLVTVTGEKQISSRGLQEERIPDTTVVDDEQNANLDNELKQGNVFANSGNAVVEYAKQFIGYPYVVGGKTPESGFDCSGFTRYVFLNFEYTLGTTAANQTNVGTEVSRDELQPGDLILFYNEEKTKIGHTGVYIEEGNFVHAANPDRGVVTDNMNSNSYYNERFVTARRIVK